MNIYDYYITPKEYEKAKNNGILPQTLNSRIRDYGWDKGRAINTPPRKKRNLKKWSDQAKKNGIAYTTFMNRVYNGWCLEKASTKKSMSRNECINRAMKARGLKCV